jgi:hypothetical protein
MVWWLEIRCHFGNADFQPITLPEIVKSGILIG